MERLGGEQQGQTDSIRKVAAASLIGTAIEWYDFFLYGAAAALVFNQLFFPQFDPLVGTLIAFATFTVGFVARPLGSIVFGHFGDKIGRKSMLVTTLLIMGLATAFVGLLPTYDAIGITAPIILVALRFLQGFAVGGEWGGAVLMAVEHAPRGQRGFYGSWPQIGVPLGVLTATVIFGLFSRLPDEAFLSWGWRVPFLFSFALVAVGLFIRLQILETPAFQQVKDSQTEARVPVVDVVRTYPKNLALAMGARIAENGLYFVFSTFVLTYVVTQVDLEESVGLNGVTIASIIGLATIPAFGALSDKIGRRPVYLFGAGFSLLFAFPFFWLLDTGVPFLVWVAVALGLGIGHAAMYGPQAAFFSELFGTRVRYSGAALAYALPSIVAGGLAPLIATGLLSQTGGAPWGVSLYMIAMALITFVSVFLAKETFRSDVAEEQPEERQLISEAKPEV